jgi:hypothetical protein
MHVGHIGSVVSSLERISLVLFPGPGNAPYFQTLHLADFSDVHIHPTERDVEVFVYLKESP